MLVSARGGCLLPGGASSGGSAPGGVCSGGVSALGGVCSQGGISQHALRQTPPCGQTDACENIYLGPTSLRPVIIFITDV